MAYPTRDALVQASTVEALYSLTPAQLDGLRSTSIASIEEFCGQRFIPEVKTVTVDGGGGEVIYLPQRLAALTGIVLRGSALALGDVALSDRRDRLHVVGFAGMSWLQRAEWEAEGQPRRFPSGYSDVALTGTWGWLDAEFPAPVGDAIRLDMEDQALADRNELGASVRAFRALGLESIQQGGLTASIVAPALLSPRVQRLLRPFRWQAVGALA